MTSERISSTLDPRDMLLSVKFDNSFVTAAAACAILKEKLPVLSYHEDKLLLCI